MKKTIIMCVCAAVVSLSIIICTILIVNSNTVENSNNSASTTSTISSDQSTTASTKDGAKITTTTVKETQIADPVVQANTKPQTTKRPTQRPTQIITTRPTVPPTTVNAYDYLMQWVKSNGTVTGAFVDFSFSNEYKLQYDANYDSIYFVKTDYYNGGSLYCAIYFDTFFYGVDDFGDQISGYLDAANFTANSAIAYEDYQGNPENEFYMMELARTSICDMLRTLDMYLHDYNIGITIADLGFKSFK